MPRDSQRQKVYDTQSALWRHSDLFDAHTCHGWPKDFDSIAEVQKYVNRVTRSKFWKHAGGKPFVLVKGVPNRQHARGWIARIEIPPWAYSKPIVLHELAHGLAARLDYGEPDHGGLFVLAFRRLIEQELGVEVRQEFDRLASEKGVSWDPRKFGTKFRIGG